ncbi:hypothetical protein CC1G_07227 [Coprinopsis cinerea okayama7|uniref:Calcineurin-like phosphoesterase domain-containing protein n=1 Tax=Coprinopsis cinerea (strain Okayama-7 / 130 / ATCC MYA-4618 / FGSC 9003) TaxID=240176 RepID=A8PD02_COPC7|nr:hypothetical protein CC1G_07227 [Coprinopsis cinerea okayama7\|eukprot:XP_001840497.2 hypothetical protein CC1G_07227 [Coprinopsis cinerea okayama7\
MSTSSTDTNPAPNKRPMTCFDTDDDDYHIRRSTDAVVQLEYDDPADLPPLSETDHAKSAGGSQWTRFVCISDTHDHTFPVPDGDVLLHTGDLTGLGRCEQLEKMVEWLCGLPHPVKIVIAGNHDLVLHADWYDKNWTSWHQRKEDTKKARLLLTGPRAKKAGIVYLANTSHTFSLGPGRREWTVYGSPWSPFFFEWAFNYKPEEAEELISSFPNTDILLTHGPPSGIFDYTKGGDFAGCPVLASHLSSGRLRPRLHAFGHIHEAHGADIHSWDPPNNSPSTPPKLQNDFFREENVEDDMFDDSGEAEVREVLEAIEAEKEEMRRRMGVEGMQRTVFVNAANEPNRRGRRNVKIPHGGPGFRPVVVDLKD